MRLQKRLLAALYDRLVAPSERAGLAERRRRLLGGARGRVLEVGAGTGLNVEHYPREVRELVLAEPDHAMRRRLEQRVVRAGRPAVVVEAAAERLPFPDASFDTVVATLVLCSVDEPPRALDELRRVLRPGGSLLFLEHVRADDPGLARWQERLARPWRFVSGGCRCNQATVSLIEAGPFRLEHVERSELPKAPALTRPLAIGRAVAR